MWQVFTGRQDGRVSVESEALAGLPSPFADFPTLLQNFKSNNLDIVDLVTLSGSFYSIFHVYHFYNETLPFVIITIR